MTRQIIDSLRMLLAEWLLGIILKIVLKNKEGYDLTVYIINYLQKQINENLR